MHSNTRMNPYLHLHRVCALVSVRLYLCAVKQAYEIRIRKGKHLDVGSPEKPSFGSCLSGPAFD